MIDMETTIVTVIQTTTIKTLTLIIPQSPTMEIVIILIITTLMNKIFDKCVEIHSQNMKVLMLGAPTIGPYITITLNDHNIFLGSPHYIRITHVPEVIQITEPPRAVL